MSIAEKFQFWTLIVTSFSVLIALGALIWQSVTTRNQLQLTRQQMKLNFFADYTKRYQEIILHFPEEINESNFNLAKYKTDNKDVYDNTMRYMRAYIDLCSEEYYLHKSKKISSEDWQEWKAGIEYSFSKKAFQDAWRIMKMDTDFYNGFPEWIDTIIIKNAHHA